MPLAPLLYSSMARSKALPCNGAMEQGSSGARSRSTCGKYFADNKTMKCYPHPRHNDLAAVSFLPFCLAGATVMIRDEITKPGDK